MAIGRRTKPFKIHKYGWFVSGVFKSGRWKGTTWIKKVRAPRKRK